MFQKVKPSGRSKGDDDEIPRLGFDEIPRQQFHALGRRERFVAANDREPGSWGDAMGEAGARAYTSDTACACFSMVESSVTLSPNPDVGRYRKLPRNSSRVTLHGNATLIHVG